MVGNPTSDTTTPTTTTPTTTTPTTTTPTTTPPTTPPAAPQEKVLEHFIGGTYRPFDVIITWDDSGSMNDKVTKMQNNVRDFVTNLDAKNANSKVVMMGVGFAFPTDLDNFRVVSRPIGSHNTLTYLSQYLQTASAVRQGAAIDVVMITDDNAVAPETLASQMPSTLNGVKIRYNSIIGLKAGVNTPSCSVKSLGTEYQTLSQQSGGMVLDICAQDMNPLLQQFFANLTLVNQVYQLQAKVDTTVAPVVTVDGKTLAATDYTIDAAAATLKIADAALPREKADITMEYTKAAN